MNHDQKQQACKVSEIACRLKLGRQKIWLRHKPKVSGLAKRGRQIFGLFAGYTIVALLVLFVIYLGDTDEVLTALRGLQNLVQPSSNHSITAIFGGLAIIGAILVAALRFGDARESQRRTFVSEHVSKTFTHEDLRDTYYYLVYLYPTAVFWRVEKEVKCLLKRKEELLEEMFSIRKELDDPKTKSNKRKEKKNELFNVERDMAKLGEDMFQCLESLQGCRGKGQRLYHPKLFQGSVEEKRLDSLLGYFNLIAYYYYSKPQTLTIEDIEGSIGFHIVSACRNKAVAEYFAIIEDVWKKDRERLTSLYGEREPFHYLRKLNKELKTLRTK